MFPTFGSSSIPPGTVSYASYALTASITITWPNFTGATSNVYALFNDITSASGAGLTITLPAATQTGKGTACFFNNKSAQSVGILASDGSSIGTIAAGVCKFLVLTDNSTAAGTWTIFTFGTGSSAADATTLVGYGMQVITGLLSQAHATQAQATAITVATPTDLGKCYVATGGSVACNLPGASAAGSSFFFLLKNNGSGTVTITPSGADVVDTAATVALAPNDACFVCSLGALNGWVTIGYGRSVSFAFTQLVKSVAGAADVTLTAAECANKVMTLNGVLTGNINVNATNTVSVYYVYNNTTGAFTLTFKTAAGTGVAIGQGVRDVLVCDGTNIARAVTNSVATTTFNAGTAGSPSINFSGSTSSGFYLPSANVPGVSAGGTEVMSWNSPASAVDWIDVYSAATANPAYPRFVANGTDTNIGVRVQAKGTGKFQVTDGTDTTKIAEIDASSISTGTTRTITPPDSNTKLPIISQFLTFTGPTAGRTLTLPDVNTSLLISSFTHTIAGPTAARSYTLPDANLTIPAVTAKGDMWSASGSGVMAKTAVGADGTVWTADAASTGGAKWSAAASGAPWPATIVTVQASSTTVTIPTGATRCKVRMVGGGGGGGAAKSVTNLAAGGGGGSGVYAEKYLSGLTPGNNLTATIGAAGTAGSAGTGGNGGNGGQTSLSSGTQVITTISANGGNGGTGDSTDGGAAGGTAVTTSSGADLTIPSAGGQAGLSATGTKALSGAGGSSQLGQGGSSQTTAVSTNVTGLAGQNYGAGGGGGLNGNTTGNAGGVGTAGVIIFEWYS